MKSLSRYGDFSIFQDGGRRHLGFLKFEILTVGRLKNADLRRHAKFGRNRSKRGREMAIGCGMSKCVIEPNFASIGHSMIEISRFSNFNIAAVRHLGFLNSQNYNGRQSYEGEHASSYAKFRGSR